MLEVGVRVVRGPHWKWGNQGNIKIEINKQYNTIQ